MCIRDRLLHILGQLLATFLSGGREHQADGVAVINGVDADIAGLDLSLIHIW